MRQLFSIASLVSVDKESGEMAYGSTAGEIEAMLPSFEESRVELGE